MRETENNEEEKKQFQQGLNSIMEKYKFNLLIASMLSNFKTEVNDYLKRCIAEGLVIEHDLTKKPVVAFDVKAQFYKVVIIPLDQDMLDALNSSKQKRRR